MIFSDTHTKRNRLFISYTLMILALFFIASLTAVSGNSNTQDVNNTSIKVEQVAQCPDDHPKAKKILEQFLSSPDYKETRVREGVDGLTTSQIRVLDDSSSSDKQICEELNSEYSTTDITIRITVYYQVGDYYFVLSPLIQNPDDNYYIAGPSFLSILDSNRNEKITISM